MTEQWIAAIADQDTTRATDSELDEAAAALGIELPEDYRAVMRQANGGEREFVASWVVIYTLEGGFFCNNIFLGGGGRTRFSFFCTAGTKERHAWGICAARETP